jgi:putative nucleotidyltransferase-like protein
MKSGDILRKGKLVATVLSGAWRSAPIESLNLSPAELNEVSPLLCASGAAALAWRRITNTPLDQASSAEVLHQAYRLQALQAAIHEQHIEKVFGLLRMASVDAVLAKGWAAAAFYPNRDLRPSGDIDICVRPADFQRAKEVLGSPEANDCWVDLHRSFSELGDRTIDDIFARSKVVPLGHENIRILGPEDHLALLCIHLLKHGAWRPLWLCDIAAAVETLPETFDWNIFLGQVGRRAHWISCSLGLAHQLLGARIEHLPLRTEPAEVPDWLAQGVLGHWSRLFPANHLPITAAPLMTHNLSSGRNIVKGVIERWPDPITATFNLHGRFNNFPRLPYQFADFILLVTRYLLQLPAKLEVQR